MLLNLLEAARTGHASVALRQVPRGVGVVIADGSLEALKWLALVLMTLDHINKYLFHEQIGWMFAAGRLVMPIFSFVLAYNLARPSRLTGLTRHGDRATEEAADGHAEDPGAQVGASVGAARRTAFRLALFGLCATPMSWALMGRWPLNVLFMLASAAGVIALLQRGWTKTACLLGVAGGFWVEFWWPAIGATVAAWYFCKSGSWKAAAIWLICLWSLTFINGNLWALAAVPLIGLAGRISMSLPRAKWWFYAYYPAHLLVLLAVAHFLDMPYPPAS